MTRNHPMVDTDRVPTADLRRVANGIPAQEDVTPGGRSEDLDLIAKIEHLPRDAGWLLISAGVLGVILPGVIGLPFVIAETAVVTAPRSIRLTRWIGRNPPKPVQRGLRQLGRMLDDLESRYPSIPNNET